jgi:Response regulator containing a CheY-like receiver domain and an HTH DNA-binding domain
MQNFDAKSQDQIYKEFCQAIKTKKLPFRFKAQDIILSQREFDILNLLIKGKSMREIGQILKISPRTVETYIYTAKDKTNTFTTSRLLDLFADSLF